MAYNELIKSFDRIRDYMRDFYVYGFKSRLEYDSKSARSYDNERRRIESWLSGYMSFRHDPGGKSVFISVDSRAVTHNPLYNTFKAKTFTDNDINLHFYIMDILSGTEPVTVREIVERIETDYLSSFDTPDTLDESTVRKKIKEYEELGLVCCEKQGKQLLYRRNTDSIDLDSWKDAVSFFSETDPIGLIGSYILDKYSDPPGYFSFKHHYILHALESEVLYSLLKAIQHRSQVEIELNGQQRRKPIQTVTPVKILISVQSGRRYLASYSSRSQKIIFSRLDSIKKATAAETDPEFGRYAEMFEEYKTRLWGVSTGADNSIEHLEMTIHIEPCEGYIIQRLEREKRCGRVEVVDEHTYRFIADVYNAEEMLPWLRTFTGRVVSLECSNPQVTGTFCSDLHKMYEMYGGDPDAVQ